MNEQLQTALATLIEKSLSTWQAGEDFVLAQMPDVIQQLLVWKFTVSALSFLASASLFSLLTYSFYRAIKRWEGTEVRDHPERSLAVFGLLLYSIPLSLFSLDWVQILVAPKIFLIEYASKLVGGGS